MSEDENTKAEESGQSGGEWAELLKRVPEAAKNLVNLQIVTVVGAVELCGEVDRPEVRFPCGDRAERDVFVTNINLVDSDITNVIPADYAESGGRALEFHEEQVRRAVESMEHKVDFLKSIAKDVIPALGGESRAAEEG